MGSLLCGVGREMNILKGGKNGFCVCYLFKATLYYGAWEELAYRCNVDGNWRGFRVEREIERVVLGWFGHPYVSVSPLTETEPRGLTNRNRNLTAAGQ